MELHFQINKKLLKEQNDKKLEPDIEAENNQNYNLKLHYLPCSIIGDGPANVDQYFEQYTTEENGILTNTFRGRPLKGGKLNVPDGYTGYVFEEKENQNKNSTEIRTFKALGTFENFIYWNYDKIPSKNDPIQKAFDIIEIAEALSKDITDENVEEELLKLQKNSSLENFYS